MADFHCRDCGALVTCLACVEMNAAEIPRGPSFVELYDPDWYQNDYLKREQAIDAQDMSETEPVVFETVGVETDYQCGFQAFDVMPPCVLELGHVGDHADAFGGFYAPVPDNAQLVQGAGSKELHYEVTAPPAPVNAARQEKLFP